MTSPQLLSLEFRPAKLFGQIHGASPSRPRASIQTHSEDSLCDSGPMLISKKSCHTGEGRCLWADLGPGLRREDKEGQYTESSACISALGTEPRSAIATSSRLSCGQPLRDAEQRGSRAP